MTTLQKIKEANVRIDVAELLGFNLKALSYILYIKPPEERYVSFEIPKKTGGIRKISAPTPELKLLQRNLSHALYDCLEEISKQTGTSLLAAHGFMRDKSIITNAASHRKRRFVLNIDLENFFPSINFGRVRGYFIKNKYFSCKPEVATVLAQIACHENQLPQGSPCSPVISNLIAQVLDLRLVRLASQLGVTYSRYADDLSFSTNKKDFPAELAYREGEDHNWVLGETLIKEIKNAGFLVNPKKTRMQYRPSRQEVTGLVVNQRVNAKSDYRRSVRAMAYKLFKDGEFYLPTTNAANGTPEQGTLAQLHGMFAFINRVDIYNKGKYPGETLASKEKIYKRFLIYRYIYTNPRPLLICEGKTDNIYISLALERLAAQHKNLTITENGTERSAIDIFKYKNSSTNRITGIAHGGVSELVKLAKSYNEELKKYRAPQGPHPVILILDNDDGLLGKGGFIAGIKHLTKDTLDRRAPYWHIFGNLYAVLTPIQKEEEKTKIEDLFDKKTLSTELGGKKFNPSNTGNDTETEYGKYYFAEHVVKKNAVNIDFSGFTPLLDRISLVLAAHQAFLLNGI